MDLCFALLAPSLFVNQNISLKHDDVIMPSNFVNMCYSSIMYVGLMSPLNHSEHLSMMAVLLLKLTGYTVFSRI